MIEDHVISGNSLWIANQGGKAVRQRNAPGAVQARSFLGQSKAAKNLLCRVREVSLGDHPILISGESGTGKKLIARSIHRRNHGKTNQLIVIHGKEFLCPHAALKGKTLLPSGTANRYNRMWPAHRGTILITEVSDLSSDAQLKLLDYLQLSAFNQQHGLVHLPFPVRIISTTKEDLAAQVRKGIFREDLYHLLSTCCVIVPPLRERREDIALLARYYLDTFAVQGNKQISEISSEALLALQEHDWPGNVRELENVVERATILCQGSRIEHEDLSFILPQKKNGPTDSLRVPMLYGRLRVRIL